MARLELHFIKMEALGNDFVVLDEGDNSPGALDLSSEHARKLCDRRRGVGADQILLLRKPHDPGSADARMEVMNSDGSRAETCGNGIRAIGLLLRAQNSKRTDFQLETVAGLQSVSVRDGGTVAVGMGMPRLLGGFADGAGEPIQVEGAPGARFYEVDVGNPHAILYNAHVETAPLSTLGPLLERHPRFPKRTNVEWVEIASQNKILVKVWERGAGATLACGTGACAAAAASIALKKVTSPVEVVLPGGSLRISWKGQGSELIMEGPATEIYRGKISL